MATEIHRVTHTGSISPSSIKPDLGEHLVLMCASALFTGLTQRDCTEIVACGHARTYARGELLYEQVQPARNLIFRKSSRVKHTQLSATGNEVLLWMSGSGDAVNVQTESTSCAHSCSVRAMEQCKALVRLQEKGRQGPCHALPSRPGGDASGVPRWRRLARGL